jgi:hypothetical protein
MNAETAMHYWKQDKANDDALLKSMTVGKPHFVYQVGNDFVVVDEIGTAKSSLLTACAKNGKFVTPVEALS